MESKERENSTTGKFFYLFNYLVKVIKEPCDNNTKFNNVNVFSWNGGLYGRGKRGKFSIISLIWSDWMQS